jgi:DNA-binding beta-propeller fold protein YncE
VSVDNATGAVYVADKAKNKIRRIDPNGTVETIAGVEGRTGGFADGAGTKSKFDNPLGIATDGKGTVYVGDSNNQRLRKITGLPPVPGASSVTRYPLQDVYADGIPAVCWAHDGAGRCSVRVRAGGKVIAKADADLADGERRTLRPRVASSAVNTVKRGGRLLASVEVSMNGASQPGWKPLLVR